MRHAIPIITRRKKEAVVNVFVRIVGLLVKAPPMSMKHCAGQTLDQKNAKRCSNSQITNVTNVSSIFVKVYHAFEETVRISTRGQQRLHVSSAVL